MRVLGRRIARLCVWLEIDTGQRTQKECVSIDTMVLWQRPGATLCSRFGSALLQTSLEEVERLLGRRKPHRIEQHEKQQPLSDGQPEADLALDLNSPIIRLKGKSMLEASCLILASKSECLEGLVLGHV